MKSLTAKQVTIDGEIAAHDDKERSSFQLPQAYGKAKQTPIVYYAFDLLFMDGTDLRSPPLTERRKLLTRLLKKPPPRVEPVLVAQVKFTEWTLDDQLRQPVFLGLRTDEVPKDVARLNLARPRLRPTRCMGS